MHRREFIASAAAGYAASAGYTTRTGQDGITVCKVARDGATVYLHVETAAALTGPANEPTWMTVLLDADGDAASGWHGYDFVVNRWREGDTCGVERNVGGRWEWQALGRAAWRVEGNRLTLAVPREAIGQGNGPLRFDMKWVDNVPASPGVMDFYTDGDAAPDGRFAWRVFEQ